MHNDRKVVLMKKSDIKFYDLNESKTEFLFESDAEKAAINEAMRKKPKVYKKIIRNGLLLSVFLLTIVYVINTKQTAEIYKLKASAIEKENNLRLDEKMNSSSNKLIYVNNLSNNKYEIIINKANAVSQDIIKEYTIVDVYDNAIKGIKLEEETYLNYLKLKNNLLERGYYINIRNGFRTFNDSNNIYNSYVKEKGLNYAKKYVAKPGTSEHNTGLAFDFIITNNKNSLKTNYESDEYFYLENIAYLYGFIIRYPKDKEEITGYNYEPWHLRYVGQELAKYLKKNNLTLEEYYETRR